jgi:glycosyltransferase involved in cell wall biosynthesis
MDPTIGMNQSANRAPSDRGCRLEQIVTHFLDKLGRYPTPGEVEIWEAHRLAAPSDWQDLFRESYPEFVESSPHRMDEAEESALWLDVTQTIHYPYQTGIQRVVHQFIDYSRDLGLEVRLFRVDLKTGQPYRLELDSECKSGRQGNPSLLALSLGWLRQTAKGWVRLTIANFRNLWLVPLSLRSGLAKRLLVSLDKLKSRVRTSQSSILMHKTGSAPVLRFHSRSKLLLLELVSDPMRGDFYSVLDCLHPNTTLMIHDLLPLEFPATAADPNGFLQHLRLLRHCKRIAVYPGNIEKVRALNQALKLPEKEIQAFSPGGHDHRKDSPEGGHSKHHEETARKSKQGSPAPLILSVGTLEPRKNQSLLLRAGYVLASRGIPFRLVIAGFPGWKNQEFYAKARWLLDSTRHHSKPQNKFASKLPSKLDEPWLQILEAVSPDHLNELYRDASFVVLPSFGEGFGLPVQEALDHGKKVLASTGIPRAGFEKHSSEQLCFFDPLDLEALVSILTDALKDDSTTCSTQTPIQQSPEWTQFVSSLYKYSAC